MRPTLRHVVTVSVLVAAGCTLARCAKFDREDRITDLRVLAVRTEPAEVLYSPIYLLPASERPPAPLPSTDIDIEVFAFEPRGGLVRGTTQLCPPAATDSSCRLFDYETDFIAPEPAAARPELEAVVAPREAEGRAEVDATAAGRIPNLGSSATFTPAVIDAFISDDSNGKPVPSVFSYTPRFVVALENADLTKNEGASLESTVTGERAFKRVPVTLDLASADLPVAVRNAFSSNFGITICDAPLVAEGLVEGPAPCLAPRGPNKNPGLRGFHIEPAALPDGIVLVAPDQSNLDVGTDSRLAAAPGTILTLSPVFAADAVEPYQVITLAVEAQKIGVETRLEELAVSWYSTRGDISDTLTAIAVTETLGVRWALPTDALVGEQDTLVAVVVDQRGGTAVGLIQVTYR